MRHPAARRARRIAAAVLGAAIGFGATQLLRAGRENSGTSDPAAAEAALEAARSALQARDLGRAKAELERCVALGDLPACHANLGVILSLQGDPSAIHHLEAGARADPPAVY